MLSCFLTSGCEAQFRLSFQFNVGYVLYSLQNLKQSMYEFLSIFLVL